MKEQEIGMDRVYDLLALAVAFLAISGLIFWLRGRRNGKQNGQRQNPES